MGSPWQTIHTRFPVICEGQGKKGNYKGCCAWNEGRGFCNHRVFNPLGPLGECSYSVEAAVEMEKQILKGEI